MVERVPADASEVAEQPFRESRRGFLKRAAGVTLGIVGGSVLVDVGVAEAATYHCVATTPVRNGPCIYSKQVATYASGTSVDVGSQTGGSRLASGPYPNNGTWNRLTNGLWIHDHYLSTPANGSTVPFNDGLGGYALFSNGLPRTTPGILGRTTDNAVTWWSETQFGVTDFVGYCLAFVWNAWQWGANHNIGRAATAYDFWKSVVPASGKHGGTPPQGAIGFWTSHSGEGHCAISAGGGYFISSWDGSSTKTISWLSMSQINSSVGGSYLGWWLPE